MTLSGFIESLGLGAAGEARSLVEQLPGQGLLVATAESVVERALERAGHRTCSAASSEGTADAALLLALPEGDDDALALVARLVAAVRPGGSLIAADDARSPARARTAGLLLRVGLAMLRQDIVGGTAYTSGKVRPNGT